MKDKTLVALGCSFTIGSFEDDHKNSAASQQRCLERSWPTKLKTLANFKKVDNLAKLGGSNARAQRVLVKYLKENTENLVVIFAVTELSRFETVYRLSEITDYVSERYGDYGYFSNQANHLYYRKIDARRKKFLEYYYTALQHDLADIESTNRNLLMISMLLKSLNIQHYFIPMLCDPNSIEEQQLGFKLPIISFYDEDKQRINAYKWMRDRFSPGYCGHFDHDANQALAEYIYEQIKEEL